MNNSIASIAIFFLIGFWSKSLYGQYNFTDNNCPPCTEYGEQIRVAARQMDVIGSTPNNHYIGRYPAKKFGTKNWYPKSSFKQTLIGNVSCFDIYKCNREADFNHYIEPNRNYRYLVANARPNKSSWICDLSPLGCAAKPTWKCFGGCCDDWGNHQLQWHDCNGGINNCIEAEITPDYNFRETPYFRQNNVSSTREGQDICVYGPWVTEYFHNHRPEIHPSELMWWKDNNQYTLIMLQDASSRFNKSNDFTKYNGMKPDEDADWQPWANSVEGRFRIAFALNPNLEYLEYNIDVRENQGLMNSNRDYLRDGTTRTVHELFYNGNLVLSVAEDVRFDDFIGVQIVDVCKDSDGILHGFIEIDAVIEEQEVGGYVLRGGGFIDVGSPIIEYGFLALNVTKRRVTFSEGIGLFEIENFRGYSQFIAKEGYYTNNDLEIFKSSINSMRIPSDYKVALFSQDNFNGYCKVFHSDENRPWELALYQGSVFVDNTADNYDKVGLYDAQQWQSSCLSKHVGEGSYSSNLIFPLNDRISTVTTTPKYNVVVYENDDFGGDYIHLPTVENSSSIIKLSSRRKLSRFNNKVSSVYIDDTKNNQEQVQFYSKDNFKGKYISLFPGKYKTVDILPVGNDDISSISIACTCIVLLYENDNFQGDTLIIGLPEMIANSNTILTPSNIPDYPIYVNKLNTIKYDFDNKTSSIEIVNWQDWIEREQRMFEESIRMDVGFIHPRDLVTNIQVGTTPFYQPIFNENIVITNNGTIFNDFKIENNTIYLNKISLFEENKFEILFDNKHTYEFEIPSLFLINANVQVSYESQVKSQLLLSDIVERLMFEGEFSEDIIVMRYNNLSIKFTPFYSIFENGTIKPEEKSDFVESVNQYLFTEGVAMNSISYHSNAFLYIYANRENRGIKIMAQLHLIAV